MPMVLISILLIAVLLDTCLGEPRRFHPLVGFGNLANKVEQWLYGSPETTDAQRLLLGIGALLLAIVPLVAIAVWLQWSTEGITRTLLAIVVLYIAIGHTSLRQHAQAIGDALAQKDLPQARQALGYIVSRNTDQLNVTDISAATIESVLENGNDAIFGALFWYIVAGIPGVVLYRLVNTLDAMWGYKNDRYLYFGRAAAYLDDILNWVPARLTALSYALLGNTSTALHCWKEQGTNWKSPNSGPVMASGAGALQISLGGAASYHGEIQRRPILGLGAPPDAFDINRALRLVLHTLLLWIAAVVIVTALWLIAF